MTRDHLLALVLLAGCSVDLGEAGRDTLESLNAQASACGWDEVNGQSIEAPEGFCVRLWAEPRPGTEALVRVADRALPLCESEPRHCMIADAGQSLGLYVYDVSSPSEAPVTAEVAELVDGRCPMWCP